MLEHCYAKQHNTSTVKCGQEKTRIFDNVTVPWAEEFHRVGSQPGAGVTRLNAEKLVSGKSKIILHSASNEPVSSGVGLNGF